MGKDYYAILGVDKDADEAALKKAYRKMAMKWHPDKNKDNEAQAKLMFQDIAEAYEVLSDKEKRDIFDRYGEEGLKQGVPDGSGGARHGGGYRFQHDPNAIFAQFFGESSPFGDIFGGMGGMGGMGSRMGGMGSRMGGQPFFQQSGQGGMFQQGQGRKVKPEPEISELPVSLDDLYSGFTKRLKVTRQRVDGQGRASRQQTVIVIEGKRGWKAGTKVTFEGEGDQQMGAEPADLVFVICEKPHASFKREGNNLVYRTRVSLLDALCGANFTVRMLDGRTIPVQVKNIISPNSVKIVKGEGMPISKHPESKGDLHIYFDIAFPAKLSDDQKQHLRALLPTH